MEGRARLEWKVMRTFTDMSHQNISQAHKQRQQGDRHNGMSEVQAETGGGGSFGSH